MANMVWTEQLSLGNFIIDSGHQNLIGMINSIEYEIEQQNPVQLLEIFGTFCGYAQLHFRDEEKIMRAIRFPFIPHKLEHQRLLDELQDARDRLAAKNGRASECAMDHYPEFLRGWFVDHINGGIATLKPVLENHHYDFMPV